MSLDSDYRELEEIFRLVPVGLCVVDRELRFVRANQRYADTVGYEIQDLIGRSMREVIPVSACQDAVDEAARVIATGEPAIEIELLRRVPAQLDLDRTWLVNIHPVRREGTVTGAIAVIQDVTEIRRAEEAAKERLHELESIYRNAPVGLSFIDRGLRYLRVNQTIADMNGVSIEEIVGRTYREISPETADAAEPFLRDLIDREESVHGMEVRSTLSTDPGVVHDFLLSAEPVRDARGEVIGQVSAMQDITSLRQTEEALVRRLEELEAIYANTPVGLCHMDTELRITRLNRPFAQLSRRPAEEQIGASVEEVLPEALARQLVPEMRAVAEAGAISTRVQIRGHPAESCGRDYTWIARIHPVTSQAGDVTGLITVLEDVSELADHQRETEIARDRLEEAQRISRVGSWEWNILDDEVVWSLQMREIFGEDPDYLPSYDGFFEHVHPTDREKVREQLQRTLESGEASRVSFRIIRGDGSEVEVSTAAALERAADGQPARLVGTCQESS